MRSVLEFKECDLNTRFVSAQFLVFLSQPTSGFFYRIKKWTMIFNNNVIRVFFFFLFRLNTVCCMEYFSKASANFIIYTLLSSSLETNGTNMSRKKNKISSGFDIITICLLEKVLYQTFYSPYSFFFASVYYISFMFVCMRCRAEIWRRQSHFPSSPAHILCVLYVANCARKGRERKKPS